MYISCDPLNIQKYLLRVVNSDHAIKVTCWKSTQKRGFWEDGSGSVQFIKLIKPSHKRTEHLDNKTSKPGAAFKAKLDE